MCSFERRLTAKHRLGTVGQTVKNDEENIHEKT